MLVKESLYNFKRGDDPIQSSGLGKISLIKKWLDNYEIIDYVINDDYTIDVKNLVILNHEGLKELPEYIQFNKTQTFLIYGNLLKSFRWFPYHIYGRLDASDNYFQNLDYFPLVITGEINLRRNDVKFKKSEILKKCQVLDKNKKILL